MEAGPEEIDSVRVLRTTFPFQERLFGEIPNQKGKSKRYSFEAELEQVLFIRLAFYPTLVLTKLNSLISFVISAFIPSPHKFTTQLISLNNFLTSTPGPFINILFKIDISLPFNIIYPNICLVISLE